MGLAGPCIRTSHPSAHLPQANPACAWADSHLLLSILVPACLLCGRSSRGETRDGSWHSGPLLSARCSRPCPASSLGLICHLSNNKARYHLQGDDAAQEPAHARPASPPITFAPPHASEKGPVSRPRPGPRLNQVRAWERRSQDSPLRPV